MFSPQAQLPHKSWGELESEQEKLLASLHLTKLVDHIAALRQAENIKLGVKNLEIKEKTEIKRCQIKNNP